MRRIWLTTVAVVAVAIPALMLVRPVLRRPDLGAAYERCRLSLAGRVADTGIAGPLLRAFATHGEWTGPRIAVNSAYDAGAVNVLLPDSVPSAWDEAACGIPAAPVECIARSDDRTVVCNPAFARQVLSRRAQPGPWQPGAYLGARFLVFSILGHELAHLRDTAAGGEWHALRPLAERDLSCVARDSGAPTSEERADEWGSRVAGRIIQNDPVLRLLPTAPASVLGVLQQVRGDLDREYFAHDDACRGDRDYPSLARRKHTFARNFLSSIYVDSTNPVLDLLEEERRALERTERILRARQLRGHVASGAYGRSSLYDHTVVEAGARGAFLTFDASGTTSTLWLVRRDGRSGLSLDSLRSWPNVGRVLHQARDSDGVHLVLTHADTLSEVTWRCRGNAPREGCLVVRVLAKRDGSPVTVGLDGSLAVRPQGRVTRFRSYKDLVGASPTASWDQSAQPKEITTDADLTIAFTVNDGGLYTGQAQRHGAPTPFMLDLEGETGCLQAPRLVDARLVFLMRRGNASIGISNCDAGFLPKLGIPDDAHQLTLWDCPASAVFPGSTGRCIVYDAPQDVGSYVPTGSLDLAALVEVRIDPIPGLDGALAVFNYGSAWIVDRRRGVQDVIPARGVVRYERSDNTLITYRARIVDQLRLDLRPVRRHERAFRQPFSQPAPVASQR